MDDINNSNGTPRTYTEEEVLQLFQRFKNEERVNAQREREERSLPEDILTSLETNSTQEKYRRYKKELTRYTSDDWTKAEEINKSLLPKLKQYTVETTQVVASIYKGSEIIRTLGRGATELFEQLSILKAGEISSEEAHTKLDEACENARELAVILWAQSKQQDDEARDYAVKALKLPTNLKHLETKETGKKEAFSSEFMEQYNEAKYQQTVLRAAINNNSSHGHGRGSFSNNFNHFSRGGRGSFYNRGGKNYFGGRGRGNPTHYHQGYHSHQQQTQQQPRGDTTEKPQ